MYKKLLKDNGNFKNSMKAKQTNKLDETKHK